MKKVWHKYTEWEDYKNGMWRTVTQKELNGFMLKAVEFTGNAKLYGENMLRVIKEWPISTEENLTDQSINQKAWVGHAATCLAIDCPEYITRMAWGKLTKRQQEEANAMATNAIYEWNIRYKNNDDRQFYFRFMYE